VKRTMLKDLPAEPTIKSKMPQPCRASGIKSQAGANPSAEIQMMRTEPNIRESDLEVTLAITPPKADAATTRPV